MKEHIIYTPPKVIRLASCTSGEGGNPNCKSGSNANNQCMTGSQPNHQCMTGSGAIGGKCKSGSAPAR